MRIISEQCNNCGICEAECHRNAVTKDNNGKFIIDASLCNNCEGLLDYQCAWVCPCNCIVDESGNPISITDRTARLRPDHILYMVAVLGAGNSGRYVTGREWVLMRNIIAEAFRDPRLMIRIVPTFDDGCIGCKSKKDPKHVEKLIWEDKKTLDAAGFKYGQVINFWDAISAIKKNITKRYLKKIGKSDVFIKDFFDKNR